MVQDVLAPGPQERFDLDANDESRVVLQDAMQRFGTTFRVASQSRPNDSLVILNAEDIRRVLLTHRANYVKGIGIERVRVLLGNGLMASEGELWSRQRRLVQPSFHSQVIRSFTALMLRLNH